MYYSYDYFKKLVIQKVYGLDSYDAIIQYSDNFDLFAMNAMNIIISGVPIFQDVDVPRIIVNRYRLDNINITVDDLNPDLLNLLVNKINLVLRVTKIEKSSIRMDQIWFVAQVERIINSESKTETM